MPTSCSAYNCTNRQGKIREDGSKVQFHKFPFKRPDILVKWIVAVRRKSWQPTYSSVLCGEHFTDDCYTSLAGKYLTETAVPSIFSFPDQLHPKAKPGRRKITNHALQEANEMHIEEESDLNNLIVSNRSLLKPKKLQIVEKGDLNKSENSNHSLPESKGKPVMEKNDLNESLVSNTLHPIILHIGTALPEAFEDSSTSCQKTTEQNPSKKALQRKVKILQQKLKRRDQRISDLKSTFETIHKHFGMSSDAVDELKDNRCMLPFELLTNRLKKYDSKPKGNRYSSSIKEFAQTLYRHSPTTYSFLREKYCLPHPSMVRLWVSSAKCNPEIMEKASD